MEFELIEKMEIEFIEQLVDACIELVNTRDTYTIRDKNDNAYLLKDPDNGNYNSCIDSQIKTIKNILMEAIEI
jgi:hypothetical protein